MTAAAAMFNMKLVGGTHFGTPVQAIKGVAPGKKRGQSIVTVVYKGKHHYGDASGLQHLSVMGEAKKLRRKWKALLAIATGRNGGVVSHGKPEGAKEGTMAGRQQGIDWDRYRNMRPEDVSAGDAQPWVYVAAVDFVADGRPVAQAVHKARGLIGHAVPDDELEGGSIRFHGSKRSSYVNRGTAERDTHRLRRNNRLGHPGVNGQRQEPQFPQTDEEADAALDALVAAEEARVAKQEALPPKHWKVLLAEGKYGELRELCEAEVSTLDDSIGDAGAEIVALEDAIKEMKAERGKWCKRLAAAETMAGLED